MFVKFMPPPPFSNIQELYLFFNALLYIVGYIRGDVLGYQLNVDHHIPPVKPCGCEINSGQMKMGEI